MAKAGRSSRAPFSKKKSILLVDDHPLARRGLRELLDAEPDLEVCDEADTPEEALDKLARARPDLAIIDLALKENSGLDLIKTIHESYPEVRMLVSSHQDETLFAERVLRAGAKGYVDKDEPPEQIVCAARDVLDGHVYLSDEMSERLLYKISQGDESAESPLEALSDREIEVFRFIGQGMSTRDIAEQLGLSVKTIDTYRENIKEKLHLASGNELIRYAVTWTLEAS